MKSRQVLKMALQALLLLVCFQIFSNELLLFDEVGKLVPRNRWTTNVEKKLMCVHWQAGYGGLLCGDPGDCTSPKIISVADK